MKDILNNRWLLLVLFVSLAFKFYICFGTGLPWYSVDSYNYINQAKALLNGDYLYYFPNGYPLIISLFIPVSSIVPLHISLILLNIILSTIAIFFIYKISEKYLDENKYLPLIAAAIAAFYPNQFNYVRLILTEVPATFFLILSLFLYTKGKVRSAALSIGYAAVIRTTLLPVPILIVVYLFIKKKNKEGLNFLLFSLLPLTVFLVYGYFITGEFTLFIDLPKVFYISLGLDKVPSDFTTGLIDYFNYLIKDPLDFIFDRLKSLWDMWGFLPSATEGLRENLFFRLLIGLRFPLLVLALYGFVKNRKDAIDLYLILPAFVITTIHTLLITSAHELYISNPRYIFPTEPFLIILSMFAIDGYLKKKLK